jgi:hypothetical protein
MRGKLLPFCYKKALWLFVMQEGPAIEDKWIHSVEKELRELEQENARLKTLLKEQGEK